MAEENRGSDVLDQVIRRECHGHDVQLRTLRPTPALLRTARSVLRATNRLETMAVQVYRAQWTPRPTELNRQLIAAMDNELIHQADSLSRLMEFGGRPTLMRLPYYVVGWLMGRVSRMFGLGAMMRLGAWVEAKAVKHYRHLSEACRWDADTYEMLVRMGEDEKLHKARWEWFNDHPEAAMAPPDESSEKRPT